MEIRDESTFPIVDAGTDVRTFTYAMVMGDGMENGDCPKEMETGVDGDGSSCVLSSISKNKMSSSRDGYGRKARSRSRSRGRDSRRSRRSRSRSR